MKEKKSFMALNSNELNDLKIAIADRIYIRVASWNLYLGDAGLAADLAFECNAHLDKGADIAARKSLEIVQVELGEGKTKMPLIKLITSVQITDLEEILSNYCL
tara:strand:+ start:346 stop:657 length:312 start_codon:yes stop_codon:yes gene_type:complete